MDKELANWIVQKIENNCEEAKIHDKYAGRGMMGRTTVAVSFDHWALILPILIEEAYKDGLEDGSTDVEETRDYNFLKDLGGFQIDNLGRGFIIY
jgi:hypothetical protein